jgi:hypothetical protein
MEENMSGRLEETASPSDYQVSSRGLSQGNSYYSNSSGQRKLEIQKCWQKKIFAYYKSPIVQM